MRPSASEPDAAGGVKHCQSVCGDPRVGAACARAAPVHAVMVQRDVLGDPVIARVPRPAVSHLQRLQQIQRVRAASLVQQIKVGQAFESSEHVIVPVQRVMQLGELGTDQFAGRDRYASLRMSSTSAARRAARRAALASAAPAQAE